MTLTTESIAPQRNGYLEIEMIGQTLGTAESPIVVSTTVDVLGVGPCVPKPGSIVTVEEDVALWLVSWGKAKIHRPTTKARRGD